MGCPLDSDTRIRSAPGVGLGWNTIVPSSAHVPPRPFGASQSVTVAPPVRAIFFRRKVASDDRLHAQDREDVHVDARRSNSLGTVTIEGDRPIGVESDVGKGGDARLPPLPLVVREPGLIEALPRAPDDGNAIGIAVRERREEYLLDDAEERGCRADA